MPQQYINSDPLKACVSEWVVLRVRIPLRVAHYTAWTMDSLQHNVIIIC